MSIKKLSLKHLAIMRRLIFDGVTQRAAAREFGISESHLSIIIGSPVWKEREELMEKEAL